MNVDEFTHEDGRECIRVGRSPIWSYDGPSEKGDVCEREHRPNAVSEPVYRLTFGAPLSAERLVDLLGVPDGLTREQAIGLARQVEAKVDEQ